MSVATANPTTFDVTVTNPTTGVVAAIRAAWARRMARLAYQDLLERDDHVFRDIGVTRGDVRRAMTDCR